MNGTQHRRIADYPNLSGCPRHLPDAGLAATVHMDPIRNHRFRSHPMINPHGIVAIGPVLDFTAPNDRVQRLGQRIVRAA